MATNSPEVVMGRLIVSAQMTVDCVMDPIEEWLDSTLEEGDGVAQLRAADALILGRKTYQALAEYWPKSNDAYAQLINPMTKYVASRTIANRSLGTRTFSSLIWRRV